MDTGSVIVEEAEVRGELHVPHARTRCCLITQWEGNKLASPRQHYCSNSISFIDQYHATAGKIETRVGVSQTHIPWYHDCTSCIV